MTADRFVDYRHDPVTMAQRLLGQRLVRIVEGERLAGIIVEAEAYLGAEDRAAHTFGGRRTRRNESMYREGGHAYVYFTYGMHHCLNVVCGKQDEGVAVLIRAVEPTKGIERMRLCRPRARGVYDLCSGPGKVCASLSIDLTFNGVDLRSSDELFIERVRSRAISSKLIGRTPRIGVSYAGDWAARPLRMFIRGNPHVSGRRIGARK